MQCAIHGEGFCDETCVGRAPVEEPAQDAPPPPDDDDGNDEDGNDDDGNDGNDGK